MQNMVNKNQVLNNGIGLLPVGKLAGMNFFIPGYQRGYRWTKSEVKALLNDIWEFHKKKESNRTKGIYCIQPLVVKGRPKDDWEVHISKILDNLTTSSIDEIKNTISPEKWEVIDGQQRLTTIYLLLQRLEAQSSFQIEYEIRKNSDITKDSKHFLSNIKKQTQREAYDNIDFYHMFDAYQTIDKWFTENTVNENDFLSTLKQDVQFIWYETDEEEPIKVFTRLNIGKIGLTDSELIKALFLNQSNFKANNRIRLVQQEIASEWDKIECTFQSDEFWLFINEDTKWNKPTRIDFLLDMVREHNLLGDLEYDSNDIKHLTFRYFEKYFQQEDVNVLTTWKVVKSSFQIMEEWYNDDELYHYIGFILHVGDRRFKQFSLGDKDKGLIKVWNEKKSKKDFLNYIKSDLISEIIRNSKDLMQLYETSDNPKRNCRSLLLLHNIQTYLNQNQLMEKSDKYKGHVSVKFPFHLFKKEAHKADRYGWEVEHIAPNAGDSDNIADNMLYALTAQESITDTDPLYQSISKYHSDPDNNDFSELKQRIQEYFGDNEWNPEDKNRIWNFTLLDSGTNQQYHNCVFPFKRSFILCKERGKHMNVTVENPKGQNNRWSFSIKEEDADKDFMAFIPICTKNVFTKSFTTVPQSLISWSPQDAEDYLRNIEQVLMEFLFPNLYVIPDRSSLQKTVLSLIPEDELNGHKPFEATTEDWQKYIYRKTKSRSL